MESCKDLKEFRAVLGSYWVFMGRSSDAPALSVDPGMIGTEAVPFLFCFSVSNSWHLFLFI